MKILYIKIPPVVKEIVKAIAKAGGKSFAVGGTVRDTLFNQTHQMNLDSKDIDVEVFGLPTDKLVAILRRFGKVDEVGDNFAVIKVTIGDLDLDFSLPRTEVKNGTGHKGFDVVPDHTMTVEQAVLRRDFTVNALMVNLMTNELIDFVGGLDDIKNRLLRHVSDAFKEDPLRVLRAMQFAARFKLDMVEETFVMCCELKSEFPTITKERLWIEWEKFLGKGLDIGKGIDVLFLTKWFELFPLDGASINHVTSQIKRSHKFGLTRKQRVIVGLALMEMSCEAPLTDFLTVSIDDEGKKIEREVKITREVKELLLIEDAATTDGRISHSSTLLAIGRNLRHCAFSTVIAFLKARTNHADWKWLDKLTQKMFTPMVTGKDLIDAGWNPRKAKKAFGEELDRLFILQIKKTLNREELLNHINEPI